MVIGDIVLKELDDLKKAIEAKRFDGRIAAIRKTFKAYKKSLEKFSWWEQFKRWVRGLV